MEAQLNGITLGVDVGDLSTQAVDALVISATNDFDPDLSTEMGRHVLQKAGPVIRAQMSALPKVEIGDAVMTVAGNLPARHLIHAVCPTMGSGGERGKLVSLVWNVLNLAVEKKLRTVAFSPLAIERFGYPIEGCAGIMAHKIVDFTFEDCEPLLSIRICVDTSQNALFFDRALLREIDIARREAGIGK
jgi:O-acetyl-ADP-ribose deacetylase (regulator of RNase III)